MSNRYDGAAELGCKVYIGGLDRYASKDDIEYAFERYGKLNNVFVARNPPGFAFVEFSDPQDAKDAVRALDGRSVCGSRVRVEISHGRTKNRFSDRGGPRGGGDRGGPRGYGGMDRRGGGEPRPRIRSKERKIYSDDSRSRSRSTSKGRKDRPERERSPPRHKTSRNRSR